MLCPPPPTLNPVTIFEAARLPHRANPSRAAGSFFGQNWPFRCAPKVVAHAKWSLAMAVARHGAVPMAMATIGAWRAVANRSNTAIVWFSSPHSRRHARAVYASVHREALLRPPQPHSNAP
jgi:hypothetical protein